MQTHALIAPALAEPFGQPIHTYTRAQAIADGVLVDVSKTAAEAGFRIPVALTRAAWSDCVEWTDADSRRQTYQDEAGRLWDVLWMTLVCSRIATGKSRALVGLHRVPRGGRGTRPRAARLVAQIGPGDDGAPVLTIMQPDED